MVQRCLDVIGDGLIGLVFLDEGVDGGVVYYLFWLYQFRPWDLCLQSEDRARPYLFFCI